MHSNKVFFFFLVIFRNLLPLSLILTFQFRNNLPFNSVTHRKSIKGKWKSQNNFRDV